MNRDRKGKFQDLNALFVFGAATVLAIHILGFFIQTNREYPWNTDMEAVLLILLRFGRSLFIFATGMLLFYWYQKRHVDWGNFWRKRWWTIVLPYIIWTAIYTMFKLQTVNPVEWAGPFLHSLFTGSAFYHLYYIPLYLQLNVLFFFCKGWVEKHLRFWMVGLLFVIQNAVYLGYHYLFADPQWAIDWSGHPLLSLIQYGYITSQNYVYMYLFTFALGAYAGLNVDKWRLWTARLRIPAALVTIGIAFWIAYRFISDQVSYEESLNIFDPLYLLYTTSFLISFYPLSRYLGSLPVISGWLSQGAKYNMAIYMVHPLILFLLESYVIFRLDWSVPVLITAMFVITPPLSIFLYQHTQISSWKRGSGNKERRPVFMKTNGA
ncbi:acyltransferase [Brevibacillus ruminantium]|uniref:Acyltransferase n=1 Tax=Brevibacillus ruminantium TaxID=2950604 RepID=A0ABY4WRH2_9BACL|nr:acyltransferase [Brevibacillus ruminantium]USG68029.1 acyltransferase [Brevibacillus ruminantium]